MGCVREYDGLMFVYKQTLCGVSAEVFTVFLCSFETITWRGGDKGGEGEPRCDFLPRSSSKLIANQGKQLPLHPNSPITADRKIPSRMEVRVGDVHWNSNGGRYPLQPQLCLAAGRKFDWMNMIVSFTSYRS